MNAQILTHTADIDSSPLEFGEVDDPTPAPGEVRVQVSSCGICRTDLHIIEGDLPEARRPIIPGHQVVGVVDRVGEGCSELTVGQRVDQCKSVLRWQDG